MKNEIKERWISALESGSYQQTTGKLTNGDGFCCLGVLCEIAEQDQVVLKQIGNEDLGMVYVSKTDPKDRDSAVLPIAVMQWADMDSSNTILRLPVAEVEVGGFDVDKDGSGWNEEDNTVTTSLADLNDNYGLSFEQIAEVVRKYL